MSRDWKEELKQIFDGEEAGAPVGGAPDRRRPVKGFIGEVVAPAFEELAEALQEHERDVEVEFGDRDASLRVLHEGSEEFVYGVRVKRYRTRDVSFPVQPLSDPGGDTYRAEGYLGKRALERDLTDYGKEELLRHLVREYERHRRWTT